MTALQEPDWSRGNGLLPAVVQHWQSGELLMLGYMNAAALQATQASGKVTFFSRSRKTLWTKGETSGHWLELKSLHLDCDADALLVQAQPHGPTCHTGQDSCFGARLPALSFLTRLETLLAERRVSASENSYTASLFAAGPARIAQKVGEEGVEVALAAVAAERSELLEESADLLYHLLVLLQARDCSLTEVVARLESRHSP